MIGLKINIFVLRTLAAWKSLQKTENIAGTMLFFRNIYY